MSKYSRHVRQHPKEKHSRTIVKRTNVRLVYQVKTTLIVGCFLTAIGVLTFFTFTGVSAHSIPQLSAAKQQLVQSQAQWHAKVDKKKAPKGTVHMSSCPVDLHHAPVVDRLTAMQMTTMHNAYASFASAISAEHKPYFIYGENGKFVVQMLPLDLCKADLNHMMNTRQTFQDPLHKGNLMITSVHGDLVIYQTVVGTIGSFNYVTGRFQ